MKKLVSLVLAVAMLLSMTAAAFAEDTQTEPARFVIRSNSNKENKTENDKVKALIEEKSGIDFEVIVVAENTWNEKVNVMIAGTEKFDTLNLTAGGGVWANYASNGAIQPYTEEMLNTYLPNVMAMVPEEAWVPCKDAQGNIWRCPVTRPSPPAACRLSAPTGWRSWAWKCPPRWLSWSSTSRA